MICCDRYGRRGPVRPSRVGILAAAKGRLRESAATEHVYRGTARLMHRARTVYARCRFGRSYPAQFFDNLFARNPDPWGYEGDPVSEERKALLLDLLPTHRIPRLLEIGCAAGWMTGELAKRADAVTAVDISPVALRLAAARCEQWKHVQLRRLDLLTDTAAGPFDVIVCAGVLVFLPWSAQPYVRDRIVQALEPGGVLLLEHTRQAFPGEVAGGRIHALYAAHRELALHSRLQRNLYEALVFQRIVSSE